MKRNLFYAILVFLTIPSFLKGQDSLSVADVDRRGYITVTGQDNWFISIGGGLQGYYGTEDFTYLTQDNFAPAVDLSFGKWVMPSLGFRVQLAGLLGYGWSTTLSPYMLSVPINNLYKEQFLYLNARVDLLWDVFSMGNGYKYGRVFHLIPFIGAGAVATYWAGVGQEIGPAGSAGLLFGFRLSEHISINLELRSTFADGRMDKVYVGIDDAGAITSIAPEVEFMNSATIGVQFDISPKKFERRYQVAGEYLYQLNEARRALQDARKKISTEQDKNTELDERVYKLIKENDDLIRKNQELKKK